MRSRMILMIAASLLVTACGSSSHTDPAASGALSGNWQMSLQKNNSTLAPKTQTGFLMQTGNTVTGSMVFIDTPCSGVGNVTGTVNGSAVSLVVDPTGMNLLLSGTVGSGSMNGNYTIVSTGCTASQTAPQSGTWTATLVSPLTGNVQGSISSTVHNATYAITGQITQGPNTGISSATLSGTLNATGYCFSTATVAGAISGTTVVMNLVNPDGSQIGQINGTSSLDGTALTGKFFTLGMGPGAPNGCVDGDAGTVSFSL